MCQTLPEAQRTQPLSLKLVTRIEGSRRGCVAQGDWERLREFFLQTNEGILRIPHGPKTLIEKPTTTFEVDHRTSLPVGSLSGVCVCVRVGFGERPENQIYKTISSLITQQNYHFSSSQVRIVFKNG